MKDHVPRHRDDQRDRVRAYQQHRLRDDVPTERKPKPTWRRRATAGVLIGSMGYLIASCFTEQNLHKPKIDRYKFRFTHEPYP